MIYVKNLIATESITFVASPPPQATGREATRELVPLYSLGPGILGLCGESAVAHLAEYRELPSVL